MSIERNQHDYTYNISLPDYFGQILVLLDIVGFLVLFPYKQSVESMIKYRI